MQTVCIDRLLLTHYENLTKLNNMKIETKLLHAGIEPDPATGAIMTPIYQTSTYVQQDVHVNKGYEYSRTHNPTRHALEQNLASIENGKFGISFSSGLAAIDSVLKMLKPGDEVITTNDLYGGTFRLFTAYYQKLGIVFKFVDFNKEKPLQNALSKKTKLIWIETPTNPMMSILDIQKISYQKPKGVWFGVDNTFASPFLQNPLDQGADIVMHSATKYLSGHSDVVMGALVTKDEHLAKELYKIQNSCGAVPGPQDCFLVLRGIKTLHVRMERHCFNARKIAEFLTSNNKVDKVYYPGLKTHKNHNIAAMQMKDFGGMVSFSLINDTKEAAHSVLKNTRIFALAESLGGVESLIGHPATMTHSSVPKEKRIAIGISESLIRLSVGIESVDDLIADLENALSKSK